MTDKRLDAALKTVTTSCAELRDAVEYLNAQPKKASKMERGIAFDAVVKRFEVSFEYAWKLMKVGAEFQGSEAFGPRPAIQEAIRYGWLDDPDFWATALDARNASVHDYFGIGNDAYLAIANAFLTKSKKLIDDLSNIA